MNIKDQIPSHYREILKEYFKSMEEKTNFEVGDLVEILNMPMLRCHPTEDRHIRVGDQLRIVSMWDESTPENPGGRSMVSFRDGSKQADKVWATRLKLIKKRNQIEQEDSTQGCTCPTLFNGHHYGCPLWSER